MKDSPTIKKSNIFKPPQGKYKFWTPVYVCETPKTSGCTTKKVTTIASFVIMTLAIVLNLLWIISANYYSETGNELIGYEFEAWAFIIGFVLIFLSIIFIIMNYIAKESNILKTTIITLSVIGGLWLVGYLIIQFG